MQVILVMELNEINVLLPAWNIFAAVLWLKHIARDRLLEEPRH